MSPDQYWLVLDRLGLNLFAVVATGLGLHSLLGIADIRRWARVVTALAILSGLFALGRIAALNAEIAGGIDAALNTGTLPFAWSALRETTLTLAGGIALLFFGALIRSRWLLGLGALVLAASFAMTGHSVSASPNWATQPAVAAHVLIAGFWVAAPATLYPTRTSDDHLLIDRLERFSRTAVIAIPILVALGLLLGWRIAGGLDPLLSSAYGWLILSKLALTASAMVLGALNKFHLTDLLRREPQSARRILSLTLRIEALLFFVALLVVSLATTVLPPEV